MHTYSTDCPSRKNVPFWLAVVGILAAWTMHQGLTHFKVVLPWWVETPSVMGFYFLFFQSFDRFLWKSRLLQKLGVIQIPDLNGAWRGNVSSSFDDFKEKKMVTVSIRQTWSSMEICLKAKESSSTSAISSFLVVENSRPELIYEYKNDPKATATDTMHSHRGVCRVNLDGDELEGDFYSGRDRKNHGVIKLTRKAD